MRHMSYCAYTIYGMSSAIAFCGIRFALTRADEELMLLAEVREKLREMLLVHYTGWLDTELPIFGNRTPRLAARDADGREAVEALVAQIERDAQTKAPPLDLEITQMPRRQLGLASDSGY